MKVSTEEKEANCLRGKSTFQWKTHCFYCTLPEITDSKHLDCSDFQIVRTLELRNKIIEICKIRNNEESDAMYMRLLSSTTNLIKPERLPPTINAAKYHCYRVYVQINQWLNFNKSSLNPIESG